MDEIGLLVEETFRQLDENLSERQLELLGEEVKGKEDISAEVQDILPEGPGLIYHIQKSTSIFVIRSLVSRNIRQDNQRILAAPEEFPSLRLLEGGEVAVANKIRFFLVEDADQAEIIHDQLNNRRFPKNEEMMCNLSDPGFSWWLTPREKGFQLAFTMSVSLSEKVIKLGPLGDRELALKNFQLLEQLFTGLGLELSMQNETNRVQFTDGEEILLEELRDLFEFGVVSDSMRDLFKLLAFRGVDHSSLEMCWFYLQEVAAVRRFWIQIEYDLSNDIT